MLARLERTLPRGDQWRYEPKLDGFHGLLWHAPGGGVCVEQEPEGSGPSIWPMSSNWTETYAKDSSQVDVVRRKQRADRRPAQQDRWGRAAVSALRVQRL